MKLCRREFETAKFKPKITHCFITKIFLYLKYNSYTQYFTQNTYLFVLSFLGYILFADKQQLINNTPAETAGVFSNLMI